ncbi:aminotransferase class III, partial [Humibacillus xanthopallidus]
MSWMVKWPGDFPVFVESAAGAHFTCVDGIDHVDLCLGDTGAMMGHSPAATVDAVTRQLSRGITTMLPTEDAIAVSTGLAERFGLPYWQFTLTATDANRHAIRYARLLTGRPRSWCTTGATTARSTRPSRRWARRLDRRPAEQHRRPGADLGDDPCRRVQRPRALERALAHGDVAAILVEPALTNIGIVLPDD